MTKEFELQLNFNAYGIFAENGYFSKYLCTDYIEEALALAKPNSIRVTVSDSLKTDFSKVNVSRLGYNRWHYQNNDGDWRAMFIASEKVLEGFFSTLDRNSIGSLWIQIESI